MDNDPPVSESLRQDLGKEFAAFRDKWGRKSIDAGWDRLSIFGHIAPVTTPQTMSEVSGVLMALVMGWEVIDINPERIVFASGDLRMAYTKSGIFVAGSEFHRRFGGG